SPHAELIRRRNNIVFNLVESERDYVHQLEILVANYVRPFRMAASSKKPPITHEDVNSIFLNTEIILFLHQIFYKGLSKKLENWPTFYTGDLFDMLISMLHIYLEYVRNHHYSLQCLVECKLGNPGFNKFLERCEMKAACEGLTLDTLLVSPMNRIPYYIVTLANCLSHTPHAHVEREKLEQTKSKLEELSKIMHDEVSETEHIRTNLAIERSIAEGCDVLLDVNQVLCRQDSLILWIGDRNRLNLGQRFGIRDLRRNEIVVQCYLFSNHLVITTRASSGKLHLVKGCGVIPLADVTLVEDITTDPQYLLASVIEEDSIDNTNSNITENTSELDLHINRLFRLIVESRDQTPYSATFVANDEKHKSEWCTDIAQCLQNLRYTQLVTGTFRNASSVIAPESVKSDVKLYKDDSEIKYSKTLDSCKIPQIRHATVERLLERLTDLRFLSIDFLNTFLLTYRLYTDAYTVMETLIRVYKSSPHTSLDHTVETDGTNSNTIQKSDERQKEKKTSQINEHDNEFTRRVSEGAKLLTANFTTEQERDLRRHSHIGTFCRGLSIDHNETITTAKTNEKKLSIRTTERSSGLITSSSMNITASIDKLHGTLAPLASSETFSDVVSICRDEQQKKHLSSNNGISNNTDKNSSHITKDNDFNSLEILFDFPSVNLTNDSQTDMIRAPETHCRVRYSENTHTNNTTKEERKSLRFEASDSPPTQKQRLQLDVQSATTSQNVLWLSKRLSEVLSSPRQSIRNAAESSFKQVLPGVVVTSSRSSRRRISSAAATQAFAVATSGESPKSMRSERLASNQGGGGSISTQTATTSNSAMPLNSREQRANEYIIVNTASTMRVLNVLRHWLTKHPLDFHTNPKLKEMVLELLQDMLFNNHLIASEQKAAVAIIKQLETAEIDEKKEQLLLLLNPKQVSNATFDHIAVSDLAEQMTLIDYKLFCALGSEELLLQGWMKPGRDDLAPNVALVSRRFNEMCRLVITEILCQPTISARVQCIEKWCTVADICRYLRNFNGVLQIMAAFVNSSVYRLKQTWDRISKQNKQVINKLQNLVHSDGKFKNLRDTLTKVDPPCVPYLGLYLSDLTFIEESSQDISENLINFSKMRMKTHIISEVHRFQSTPFKIKHNPRVCAYLLDRSRLLTEDQCYLLSLKLEPRTSRVGLTGFGV
ncbi:unnamed protein product, partial [Rotaria sp. Silwood2]